ncbi:DUF6795 domain-containing protein [Microbulbifer sp. SAOS-129_SWC]|uniref:DUF6795 domain-containing protein n=1 Tax=Microbulbifer sp. SAOS-129_SWC TaxID=3145235 RepID=UPI003216EFEA
MKLLSARTTWLLLLLFYIPVQGNAMAFLNPFKACTFSEMQLKLTANGEPAAGAKVIRSVNWKEEIVDTFTADDSGRVELPATHESSITQVMPVEFVSSQVINVEYDGKNYKIWVYAKRDPGENSEQNGKPFELACELSDEPKIQRVFDSILKTSCTFN